MKKSFTLCLSLMALYLPQSPALQAQENSATEKTLDQKLQNLLWHKAFLKMGEGEHALAEGRGFDAEGYYRQALQTFSKLNSDFPQWERTSVLFRMQECRSQMANARKLRDVKHDSADAVALRAQLKKALSQRDNFSTAMMAAYRKNEQTNKEHQRMKEMLLAAQRELAEIAQAQSGEALALKMLNLEVKLKNKDKEIDRLKKENLQLTPAQIIEARANMKKKILEANRQRDDLATSLKQAKQSLAEQTRRVAQSKKLYSQLEKDKQQLQKNYTLLETTKKGLADSNKTLNSKLTQLKTSLQEEEDNKQELSQQLVRLRQRETTLEIQLKELADKKSPNAVNTQAISTLTKKRDQLQTTLLDVRNKLSRAQQERGTALQALTLEQRKSQRIATELDEYKRTIFRSDIQKKLEQSKQDLQNASATHLADLKKIKETNNSLEVYKLRLKETRAQLQQLKSLQPATNIAASDATSKAPMEARRLNQQIAGLNTDLKSAQTQYKQLQEQKDKDELQLMQMLVDLRKKLNTKESLTIPQKVTAKESTTAKAKSSEIDKKLQRHLKNLIRQAWEAEQAGKNQQAFGLYDEVLRSDANNMDTLLRAGNLYYKQQQLTEAERLLTRAFYLQPDNTSVLSLLGNIYLSTDRFHLSLSMLSRAVSIQEKQPLNHINLALAMQTLNWTEGALAEMEKAYELDPSNNDAAVNLVSLLLAQNLPDYTRAREIYRKAIANGARQQKPLDDLLKQK